MLDNSVAGGMPAGEEAGECIVREAAEEASLPEALVRERIKVVGAVSYIHVRDERAGGETGLVQPETQFAFDLELPLSVGEDGDEWGKVVLKPRDGEVEEFYCWGVEEVRAAMGRGEFNPNCALYLVDFLVRHGLLEEEEKVGEEYLEIISRLHRRIYFEGPEFSG